MFKRVVEILGAVDGVSSVTQIAEKLKLRPTTVSQYLREMEKMGLVTRKLIRGAPNRIVPELTEKGKCIVKCLSE